MTTDKKTDASKLDHATLEAMRFRAIEAWKDDASKNAHQKGWALQRFYQPPARRRVTAGGAISR